MPAPNDHSRVAALFLEAAELPPSERAAFLDAACGDDTALRSEVEDLLAHDAQPAAIDQGLDAAWAAQHITAAGRPSHIGCYEILSVIGEGGMGTVFRARQTNPNRDVALKVMRPGIGALNSTRRFEQEAQVLGRLQHSGIAQIYEAGTADYGDGPQPFFAMELIDGEPLTTYAAMRALDTRERLGLLARICDAVQHAHSRGVIHRDLKPSNILVTPNGEPKILDFGVARAVDSDIRTATLQTDVGQLIGTIPYMSPEQVTGNPDAIDYRSDVYAMGVLGYELLAEHLPLDLAGKPIPEAARVIRDEDPTRLGAVSRVYRGDIDTMFAKALAKDRQRRYQSVAEFAADIGRFLRHEPIAARPPTVTYQLRVFARRNKGLVTGLAGIFIALVAGVVVSTTLYLDSEEQRKNAETAQRAAERERAEAIEARNAEAKQRRHAARQARIAHAVSRFLTRDVISAVTPQRSAKRDITMREVFTAAAESLDRFDGTPEIEASIRASVGLAFAKLGEFETAERHLRDAVELLRDTIGESNPEFPLALNNLGLFYIDSGQWRKAEPVLERAHSLARQQLPDDHPEVATILHNYGMACSSLGNFERAAELSREALERNQRIHGERSIETTRSMSAYAISLVQQGDLDAASEILERALGINMEILGEQHPDTITDLNNLGRHFIRTGDYERAESMLERAVQIGSEVYGSEHPQLVPFMSNLAGVFSETGRYDKAARVYERTLEIARGSYGDSAPQTLTTMNNLAGVYQDQQRFELAEQFYVEVLEARSDTLGARHPATLSSLQNLGVHYRKSGNHQRAVPLLEKAVAAHERRFGPTHSSTLIAKSSLGEAYNDVARFEEAAKLHQTTVEFGRSNWPEGHYLNGDALARLGRSLTGLRRFEEAESAITAAYDVLVAAVGPEHRRTQDCVTNAVHLFEAAADPEKTARWKARRTRQVEPPPR